jgi:hypothetical protein
MSQCSHHPSNFSAYWNGKSPADWYNEETRPPFSYCFLRRAMFWGMASHQHLSCPQLTVFQVSASKRRRRLPSSLYFLCWGNSFTLVCANVIILRLQLLLHLLSGCDFDAKKSKPKKIRAVTPYLPTVCHLKCHSGRIALFSQPQ